VNGKLVKETDLKPGDILGFANGGLEICFRTALLDAAIDLEMMTTLRRS
jgi:hypothetical protein